MLIEKEKLLKQAVTVYDENEQAHLVVPVEAVHNAPDCKKYGQWETEEITYLAYDVSYFSHFHRDPDCKYFYVDNAYGGSYFCPHCGADMRGESND